MKIKTYDNEKQPIENKQQLLSLDQLNELVTDGSNEYVEQLFYQQM